MKESNSKQLKQYKLTYRFDSGYSSGDFRTKAKDKAGAEANFRHLYGNLTIVKTVEIATEVD